MESNSNRESTAPATGPSVPREATLATPEFVVWAVALRCPLREIDGWDDPERTERHLRSIRLIAEMQARGRCRDGVCLDDGLARRFTTHARSTELLAVRESDALALWGGAAAVAQQCDGCPANPAASRWAGCHGILEAPQEADAWRLAMDAAMRAHAWGESQATESPTVPRWYGLWRSGRFAPDECRWLGLILAEAAVNFGAPVEGLARLRAACEQAAENGFELTARLYPAGVLHGRWWTPARCCPDCRAPQPGGSRLCLVCGRAGASPPAEKRKARGVRPFRPLEEVLGPAEAAELAARLT